MIPIQSSKIGACDPLSDMLALLDVRSFLSRRVEASGPWALRFPAYRHMKFGGVIEGKRWLWMEGGSEILELEAGDFYLLTNGGPYCFASDHDAVPMDGLGVMDKHLQADGVVRFGSGEPRSVGVGGRFVLDDETSSLLLSMLPPIIHIRGSQPQASALQAALALITFETEKERMGTAAIGGGLCAIILVNILRAYLASGERPSGWLGALADRHDDHAKALGYFERALSLFRAANDAAGEGRTLDRLGGLYVELGDEARALAYYQEAIAIGRRRKV